MWDANHACNVQLGYTTDQLLSMDIFALIAPEKREQFRKVFSTAAVTGTQEKIETILCTSQGAVIPVEFLIRFVTFDHESYGVIVARDISERIRYERALVATQKKLNLINSLTRTDIKSQVFIVRAYLEVIRQIAKHPEEICDTGQTPEHHRGDPGTDRISRKLPETRRPDAPLAELFRGIAVCDIASPAYPYHTHDESGPA